MIERQAKLLGGESHWIFLFPEFSMVFGTPTSSQTMHAHFAVKIVVSWSGPFEVETVSGIERNVYGRVFNSLERHRIQSEHRCASLFVFPSSKATRIWLRHWPPPDDDARAYLQQRLKDFDSGTKSYDDAHVLAHAFQSIWLVGFDDPPFCDPRITKVVDWLGKRSVPTTDRFLLASIAGLRRAVSPRSSRPRSACRSVVT